MPSPHGRPTPHPQLSESRNYILTVRWTKLGVTQQLTCCGQCQGSQTLLSARMIPRKLEVEMKLKTFNISMCPFDAVQEGLVVLLSMYTLFFQVFLK